MTMAARTPTDAPAKRPARAVTDPAGTEYEIYYTADGDHVVTAGGDGLMVVE